MYGVFQPDLIFFNGSVFSADHNSSTHEAIALREDKIIATGSNQDICYLSGPQTKTIDLRGRSLLPGFNEAHNHMLGYGLFLNQVDARPSNAFSIEDIIGLIKKKSLLVAAGEWIIGRGFEESKLAEKRTPTRWDLDQASSQHPVFLKRTC